MKPAIALVITDQETNAQIKPLGVGLLELRVDLFRNKDVDYVRRQFENRRKLRIPLLLTLRNQKKEGAVKEMTDARKWEILQAAMPLTDYVDIELSCALCAKTIVLARKLHKKVILSHHDFQGMPAHPQTILKKALSRGADLVKIAAKANSLGDVLDMIVFTHINRKHPLITIALGPIGSVSRLILPGAGSRFTYTFLNKPTAPGQIDVKTLKAHLKRYYA